MSRLFRSAAGSTLVLAVGLWGLTPGDPLVALTLVERTEAQTQNRADDPWLDAARELSKIRPWQAHFWECREQLARIETARLQALRDEERL